MWFAGHVMPVTCGSLTVRLVSVSSPVLVHERTEARLPALDAVRAQVAHGLLEAASRERLRGALAALRARYELRVDPLTASRAPGPRQRLGRKRRVRPRGPSRAGGAPAGAAGRPDADCCAPRAFVRARARSSALRARMAAMRSRSGISSRSVGFRA